MFECTSCNIKFDKKGVCPRCGYKAYVRESKEKVAPKVISKKDMVYTAVQCENDGIVWDKSLSEKCPVCGKIGGKFINKKEEELVKV